MNNGLYMTREDMTQFSQWYSKLHNSKYNKSITEKSIKNVTIVLTENCNLACTYCYQHGKSNKVLTKEMAKKIVDFLLDDEKLNGYFDSSTYPCLIIDFIGGEPLLNVDVMDYFMEYFKYKAFIKNHPWYMNHMIAISSNGILYREKKFQDFLQKNSTRVSIGISIDGNKTLHDSCRVYPNGKGTYDDVLKSVKLWVTQRPQASTKMTIAPENLPYLVESMLHLWELGIVVVPANVVFEDVWDIEHARLFYKLLIELADKILENELYKTRYTTLFSEEIGKPMDDEDDKNWCGGDGSMLAIGYDGVCYPCLRYMKYCMSNKNREPLIIGHIETKIKGQDESEELANLCCITRKSQSEKRCIDCNIAQGCSWCSAYNYDVFGTANKRTTFHCEMHHARVLANVYFWNKLYNKLALDKNFEFHMDKEIALQYITLEEYNHLYNLSKGEF